MEKTIEIFLRIFKNEKILVSDLSSYPFSFGILKDTTRLSVPPIKWIEKIFTALLKVHIHNEWVYK